MATKEVLTEVHGEYRYELEPVHHGKPKKCVGLAPTKQAPADVHSPDDILDWMLNEYGAEAIVKCFDRQLKQDVKNNVRAKFNKDKVTATMANNAINDGRITPDQIVEATEIMKSGKMNFTEAITTFLGVGEDALKNADATHIHWDCAR